MSVPNGYFLIVGSRVSESISSKLSATGVEYIQKSLDSGEGNWREIQALAASDRTSGVVVTLNRKIYERIDRDKDSAYVVDLLSQVARVPHLVLVHEAVYGGGDTLDLSDAEEWDGFTWSDANAANVFGVIPDDTRLRVNAFLASLGIDLSVYKRNAEASVLAVAFIDDQLGNLLFRIYIPKGRLFEEEGAQLISMFYDWLTTVRGISIRRDGYQTANGRVIEFHSNGALDHATWSAELDHFQEFVAIIENTSAAENVLEELGVERPRAKALVAKYAKQTRRLQLDVRYERERKELAIREQLEAELLDEAASATSDDIAVAVANLLPSGVSPRGQLTKPSLSRPLVVNQQFIQHVEGVVAQHIEGTVTFGVAATEIRNLIAELGGAQAAALSDALRELVDGGAPQASRVRAKQKIKTFLMDVAGSVQKGAIGVLQKWVESQLGL